MNITYTYKIINVDISARCMEIVYSANGHQIQHIGARLPFQGEKLEDVVRQYAPIAYWEAQSRPVEHVDLGATGTLEAIVAAVVLASAAPLILPQPMQTGVQTL